MGTDVGRLGEQGGIGGPPRLESVARVAEARQHHVVVARPGIEAEGDVVLFHGRAVSLEGRQQVDRVGFSGDRRRRQRQRGAVLGAARGTTGAQGDVDLLVDEAILRDPDARANLDLGVAQAIDGPTARGRRRGAEPGSEREPARRAQPPQERPPFHARGEVTSDLEP